MREDISAYMSDQFFTDAKKGNVLTFERDGVRTQYRIVRLNRAKKICVVIPTKLHSLSEADEIMKQDLTLEDVLKEFEGIKLSTTEDVQRVLVWIAPPGKKQELKKEAVSKLFRGSSNQGFTTADTLESYEEF